MRVTVQLRSGAHLKQRKLLFLFAVCRIGFTYFIQQNVIVIISVIHLMCKKDCCGITVAM